MACTDWSWTEEGETNSICATADGVMLRLVVDGQIIEARSVKYGPQKADLFRVPANYLLPRELANRDPIKPTAALHCYCDTTPCRRGRFKIANDTPTRPVNLITGAGYQVAVTPNPVTEKQ